MKHVTVILIMYFFASFSVQAQDDLTTQAESIQKKARIIYELERAAWISSDLFADNRELNKENVESYIAYKQNDNLLCVFYSAADTILAEYTFSNSDPNPISSFALRQANAKEMELIKIKRTVYSKFGTKEFKRVKKDPNTNFNFVPVIIDNVRTCYLINAINSQSKLILGNDYIIQLDNNYNVTKVAGNHKGVQEIEYDIEAKAFYHTHIISDTFFETEIATLMFFVIISKRKSLL